MGYLENVGNINILIYLLILRVVQKFCFFGVEKNIFGPWGGGGYFKLD